MVWRFVRNLLAFMGCLDLRSVVGGRLWWLVVIGILVFWLLGWLC